MAPSKSLRSQTAKPQRTRKETHLQRKQEGAPKGESVYRPHHYARFALEPIHFIMENNLPFWAGSAIKYILRWDAKNGIEDLKKARRYLDMQIAKLEGRKDWSE